MTNSVHDMGGMHGFGPIPREDNEPIFHEEWEGRVLGLMMTTGAHLKGNIDNTRSQSEMLPPATYLSLAYYERWFLRLERVCKEKGLVSENDLAALWAGQDIPKTLEAEPIGPDDMRKMFAKGRSYNRQLDTAPLFAVGDTVRAKNINPKGHTRLPRYARGKVGIVTEEHGGQIFPDTNATFSGEVPERLYTVRFKATDLWSSEANSKDTVCIDLWEPYLETVRADR
ncbi:MAG: nitrile hydratase subunit beta [Rhodospirillaceae bacterium]|nr:nitrile hydratase subunit beta [Rhodospirillaceae bacterium]